MKGEDKLEKIKLILSIIQLILSLVLWYISRKQREENHG